MRARHRSNGDLTSTGKGSAEFQMPMTTTHALVPFAGAIAFANRPIPWRLVIAAMIASSLPDADGVWSHFLHLPSVSIFSHRGAAHSLFAALCGGLLASMFHRWLRVPALTAAVVIAASMASHGILDMMTDLGKPVAYLWPLSSVRLFADWRPIHSIEVHRAHLFIQAFVRLRSELLQLIIPMFVIAIVIRGVRLMLARTGIGNVVAIRARAGAEGAAHPIEEHS